MKTFKGSFYEIGRQQGEIYRQNGLDLTFIKVNQKIVAEQLKIYKKHYPQLLEEIEGIAVGGNFDKEKLLHIYLALEIVGFAKTFNMPLSCTIFGVKNSNGTFVGRNLDWLPITEKVMESYKREAEGCYKLLAVSDMFIGSPSDVEHNFLLYDAIDVINEKGLFVGITFAYGNTWSYGLSWNELTRIIGEQCSTVDEALDIFKNIPVSIPKNFFIADKKGNMAVVNHNSNKYKIVYPKDNVLIQTNHYTDPELSKIDRVLIETPTHNTYIRYYETLQKINQVNKNKFQLSDVIKILGNPNLYVCQNHEIKTIWTLALDMKKQQYNLYTDVVGKRVEQKLAI